MLIRDFKSEEEDDQLRPSEAAPIRAAGGKRNVGTKRIHKDSVYYIILEYIQGQIDQNEEMST